ncbi:P-II family nitrogen regulator [Bacillus tianshenii]|nr:P-II family nitrogen regulator [Bacillus tianshenii]
MKKLEAIIRPEHFQTLRKRLDSAGISGLTVSEVAGCGKQKGQEGIFRGNRFEINLYPKVKVEMVIEESKLESIIDIIQTTCATGQVGDGKIFVYPVENVIRIRTGQRGLEAI